MILIVIDTRDKTQIVSVVILERNALPFCDKCINCHSNCLTCNNTVDRIK